MNMIALFQMLMLKKLIKKEKNKKLSLPFRFWNGNEYTPNLILNSELEEETFVFPIAGAYINNEVKSILDSIDFCFGSTNLFPINFGYLEAVDNDYDSNNAIRVKLLTTSNISLFENANTSIKSHHIGYVSIPHKKFFNIERNFKYPVVIIPKEKINTFLKEVKLPDGSEIIVNGRYFCIIPLFSKKKKDVHEFLFKSTNQLDIYFYMYMFFYNKLNTLSLYFSSDWDLTKYLKNKNLIDIITISINDQSMDNQYKSYVPFGSLTNISMCTDKVLVAVHKAQTDSTIKNYLAYYNENIYLMIKDHFIKNNLFKSERIIHNCNNVATLDATGKIPFTELPSFIDDVLEFTNLKSFPTTGECSKIYLDLATNKTYRWSGSAYVYITSGTVDPLTGNNLPSCIVNSNFVYYNSLYDFPKVGESGKIYVSVLLNKLYIYDNYYKSIDCTLAPAVYEHNDTDIHIK